MSTSLFYRFVVVLLTIVAVSMSGTVFGQQTTNPGENEQPDFAVVEELLKELGTNNDPFVIAALLRSNLDRLNGATVAEFLVKLGGAPHDVLMEDLGNAVENRPDSRPMEDILSDILDAQPGDILRAQPDEHYPSTGAGGDMRPGGPPGGQYPPDQPIDKSSPGGQYGTGQGNLPPAGQNPGNIYQPRGNQDVTPAGTGQGNRSNPFGMSSPVGTKYTAPIDYALVDELLNQIGDQRDPVRIVEVLMNNLVILASLQGGHQDKYMGGQGIPPTATEQYGPPPADVQWQGAAAAEQYGPPAGGNFRGEGGVEQYGPTVAEFLLRLGGGGTPQEHLMEELGMAADAQLQQFEYAGRPMEDIIRDILNQN